jgi:hypothetical protein
MKEPFLTYMKEPFQGSKECCFVRTGRALIGWIHSPILSSQIGPDTMNALYISVRFLGQWVGPSNTDNRTQKRRCGQLSLRVLMTPNKVAIIMSRIMHHLSCLKRKVSETESVSKSLVFWIVAPLIWRKSDDSEEHIASSFRAWKSAKHETITSWRQDEVEAIFSFETSGSLRITHRHSPDDRFFLAVIAMRTPNAIRILSRVMEGNLPLCWVCKKS